MGTVKADCRRGEKRTREEGNKDGGAATAKGGVHYKDPWLETRHSEPERNLERSVSR